MVRERSSELGGPSQKLGARTFLLRGPSVELGAPSCTAARAELLAPCAHQIGALAEL